MAALFALSFLLSPTASAQTCLTTTFGGNTTTSNGPLAALVDVTTAASVLIPSIDSNFNASAGTAVSLEVWITPGTWVGNEGNQAVWTRLGADAGGVVTAGAGQPTTFTFNPPLVLPAGPHGVSLIATGSTSYRYTSGGPATYSDAIMSITAGAIDTSPFSGGANLNPRIWNGTICYQPSMGIFASFTADKTNVGPGEIVQFTDTTFTSDPAGVLGWDWDFNGDNVTDSTAQNPTWAFASCGPKDVRLTATDATGTNTLTRTGFITVGPPVASFTANPPGGPAPLVVNFMDTSTGLPTSWAWDLDGDNMVDSTIQNPVWAYPFEQLNQVTLTVTNPCGSDTYTGIVDTRSTLCTLFASNNGGASGGIIMFDLDVLNPAGVTITSFDTNFGVAAGTTGVGLDVYAKTGSYVGAETDITQWTLVSTGGTGTAAGDDNPTIIDTPNFCLPTGQHALALVAVSADHEYTNGDGSTGPGSNTYYANVDLALQAGAAQNVPFTPGSSVFSPRVWNGCIGYTPGMSTPGALTFLGAGCPSSTSVIPSLAGQGGAVPIAGSSLTLEISNAPASQPLSFVMIGFVDLGGVDLGLIGMPGCRIHPDPMISLPAATDATGVGTATIGITDLSTTIGLVFYGQAFIADPGANAFGAVLSDALLGTVGGC